MFTSSTTFTRLILFFAAITAIAGGIILQMNPLKSLTAFECIPGSGWTLSTIPIESDITSNIVQSLASQGIDASIRANNVGETDSCGTFAFHSINYAVELLQIESTELTEEQVAAAIYATLLAYTDRDMGLIELQFPNATGTQFVHLDLTQNELSLSPDRVPLHFQLEAVSIFKEDVDTTMASPATEVFNRNVLVVVYDPVLDNGERLSEFLSWNEHEDLTAGTVTHFSQASNDRVLYNIAETIVVDGWPEKVDGFIYTEAEYLAVIAGQSASHSPDEVDYNKIVNDLQLDICGKANNGEIDEVWIYNGPWFGFKESTLVGPDAYYFNSGPVPEPFSCNRLIPIMGPSPERALDSAVHNFGHRTESTMKWTYGDVWEQNSISHGWEKFGLVNAQSVDFDYSGCGSVHYPPNGVDDYDYGNTVPGSTNCDDFANYPDLSNPEDVLQDVSCSSWGCSPIGYHEYWFSRLPANVGCDVDGVANDWWQYFVHPELANDPSSLCPVDPTATPTHTVTSTPEPNGQTMTINPEADAFTFSSRPNSNLGGATTLRLDASPDANDYLRFDIQGVTGSVTQATLRLYAQTASSLGFSVHEVADNNWGELTITSNNAPALGSTINSIGSTNGNSYVDIDVTDYVATNGLISFGIDTQDSNLILISSRESGNKPELVVAYDNGAATITPTITNTPTIINTPTNTPTVTNTPVVTSTVAPTGTVTPTSTPSSGGNTFIFVPNDDAIVLFNRSTTNYGFSPMLGSDNSPDIRSYLKFDVTGLDGSVASATFRVFVNSGAVAFDVAQVADNGWLESSITYSNAPAVGVVINGSGPVSSGAWVEVDVTSYISGDGIFSLALLPAGVGRDLFDSAETGNSPELVVVTGP